jgi:hypothetical protein
MTGGAEVEEGDGFGWQRVWYRVGCVTVPTREGVRLTCGVCEALRPAWQRLEEEDGAGRLLTLDWAGVIAVLGWRREKRPTILFPISNPFSNLKIIYRRE